MTTTSGCNSASQIANGTRDNDLYAWTGYYNVDRPYTVNGLNQLTAAGAVAPGYDSRGNLTSSGATTYAYGQRDQLYETPGVLLYYDPRGRLSLTHVPGTTAREFSYDGANLTTEYDSITAMVLKRDVHGPGTDDPLVWYAGSGTIDRRWLH